VDAMKSFNLVLSTMFQSAWWESLGRSKVRCK
jgi:hypothetical protein